MSERAEVRVEKPVNSLADLRLSVETLDVIVGQVGELGVQTLKGWDAAGSSLIEGNRLATFGATDEAVNAVDQQQYDTMRGPCVDALSGQDVCYFSGVTDNPRWSRFAEAAAEAGIHSVVSFPLKLDGDVLGAMNFYSKRPDALSKGQEVEGQLFAAQAAVAVSNAKAYVDTATEAEQLSEALETRAMIGQATGLLMAQEGLTSEEAFQRLVKASQSSNMKLRDIAERFVETWENRAK
jgi:GAF domain-containing protein